MLSQSSATFSVAAKTHRRLHRRHAHRKKMMEVAAPDRPNFFWSQTKIDEAEFFRPTAGAPAPGRAGLTLGCGGAFSPARRGAAPMMRPVTRELGASPAAVRPATREVKLRTVGMRDVNAWRAERGAGRAAGPTALPAPPAAPVKQWAPHPPVGPTAQPVAHDIARPGNVHVRSSSAEAAPAAPPIAAAGPIGVVARAPSAPLAAAAPAPSPVTIRTGFRGIGAGGGVRTGGLSRRAVPTVSALRAETQAICAGTPR